MVVNPKEKKTTMDGHDEMVMKLVEMMCENGATNYNYSPCLSTTLHVYVYIYTHKLVLYVHHWYWNKELYGLIC